MPEFPEVEIHIDGHVIKGTLVSVEGKHREVAPTKNGWRVLGPREYVTVTVEVHA